MAQKTNTKLKAVPSQTESRLRRLGVSVVPDFSQRALGSVSKGHGRPQRAQFKRAMDLYEADALPALVANGASAEIPDTRDHLVQVHAAR